MQKQDFADLERVVKPVKALKVEQRKKRKERDAEADGEAVAEEPEASPPSKKQKKDQ